ncbi:MAG TPA: hypothetical protein VGD56_03440 [Gemmatirosa sp.]
MDPSPFDATRATARPPRAARPVPPAAGVTDQTGEDRRPAAATAPTARVAAVCRTLRDLTEHRPVPSESGVAFDPVPGLLAQLRAATTVYVCGLQATGARPEQMLVRVKALVRDAMAAEGWHDVEATDALVAHVVRWSIAAYYDR